MLQIVTDSKIVEVSSSYETALLSRNTYTGAGVQYIMLFGMGPRISGLLSWLLIPVGIALIAFLAADSPVARLEIRAPQTASSLQLAVVHKTGTRFMVELRNQSGKPLILNTGFMLANGGELYADKIRLELTRPDNKVLHLQLIGPAAIGGRMDPMVVPLISGATYSLPVDLENYFALKDRVWEVDLRHGATYTLLAEYTGTKVSKESAHSDMQGISLMPFWTGSVRSAALVFRVH